MAAKIVSAIATLLLLLAASVIVFFFMIIVMNGYSESDAQWGIGAFVILAFVAALLMGIVAFFFTGFLTKKQYGAFAAAIIPILVFSVVGAGLVVISGLIGVGVAEFVRVNF